jgi:hypothetical protein
MTGGPQSHQPGRRKHSNNVSVAFLLVSGNSKALHSGKYLYAPT